MNRPLRDLRVLAPALVLLAICLPGCGSGGNGNATGATAAEPANKGVSDSAVPAPGGPAQGGGVIVRVGKQTITKDAFDARMQLEAHAESPQHPVVPVPPTYTSCIEQLAALASGYGEGSTHPVPPKSRLKSECAHLYDQRRTKILKELISAEWTIVGAEEAGVALSDEEVRQKLRSGWPSVAALQQFLASTGENISDVLFSVKVQMLSARLREKAEQAAPAVTDATVARYYATHEARFKVRETRDISILRARSLKTAGRAKRELESGAAFSAVVAKIGHQPIFLAQRQGLLKSLYRGLLHEKELNDAIFSARPNVVSGPVRVNLFPGYHPRFHRNPNDVNNIDGYYIFEVYTAHPARTKSFSEVHTSLKKELPGILKKQGLVSFIRTWRERLFPQTDCSPGYVVRKCRQYKASKAEPPEDPYTVS